MRDFNSHRSGGGKRFGGGRDFGDRAERRMHRATCDECGESCEVPFKPSGEKPIFCSSCFENNGGGNRGRSEGRSGGRNERSFEEKRMYDAVCDECGDNCEVPFKPTAGKPIYCSQCFGGKDKRSDRKSGGGNEEQFKEQFDAINAKLDKILNALYQKESKKDVKEVKKEVNEVKKEVIKEMKEYKPKTVAKKVVTKKAATKKKK